MTLNALHYHVAPSGDWQRLLQIYLLAEQLQIAKQPADSTGGSEETVHARFFAAWLTAWCDPYHHHPGEIRTWHEWLLKHGDDLALALLPPAVVPVTPSAALARLVAVPAAPSAGPARRAAACPAGAVAAFAVAGARSVASSAASSAVSVAPSAASAA